MADELGNMQVVVGASVQPFEAGMKQVIAGLDQAANASTAASATIDKNTQRITDAGGRVRDGFGKFVNSATLAREAAGNVGGSLGTLGDTATRTGQSINQGLVGSFAAFDQAIKPLSAGVGRLGESLKGIGSGLTTYVTLPLGLAGGAALQAFGKIEALTKGLNAVASQDISKEGVTGVQAIGLAAQATQARLLELQEIAKAPGIGFEEAIKGDIRLRAVGITAGQSAKILREFANAIALTGGGSAELNSVTVQLGQLSAKGKVLAQDLRPIIEAAPAVSQALQKLYGTVDSETISKSLEKQGKSSQDFIEILTDELAKIPRVAGGFNTAVENALQGGQVNLARFGEAINKAFNLEGLLERVGSAFTRLTDYFTSLSPATQRFVLGAAAVAAAAGPIVFGLGAITAAIPSVVAGLEVMGLASTAALGPLGIAVAAVAAGAALIIANWDSLVAYFKGPNGAVFGDLGESIGNSVGAIVDALRSLAAGPIGQAIAGFARLQLAFDGKVLQAALAIVAAGLNFLAGNVRVVTDLFSGQFQKALVDGANTARSVVKPFQDLLGLGNQSNTTFSEFFKDILNVKDASLEGAAALDANTASLEKANGAAKNHIVTLKELQAELKEALQVRFNDAQAGRDTTADDANIARIRALIAEYKQLPGHADAATKAIAKLRAELAALTVLDNVLAVPANGIDVVQRRIDTLNAGLKRLLEAGVKPSSAAFRAFAAESLTLQRSLAGVQASAELASRPIDLKLKVTVGDFNPDQVGKLGKELENHPVLVPFSLVPLKTDFSSEILNQNIALQKNFADSANAAVAFGGILGQPLSQAAARFDAIKNSIRSLIESGLSPFAPAVQSLVAQANDAFRALQLEDFNNRLTESLVTGIQNVAVGFGEAVGQILSGAAGFEALPAIVLGALGGLAIQVGTLAIGTGLAVAGIKAALESLNPVAAIAGGIALVALGTAVKGYASNLAKGGGAVSAPNTSYSSGASSSSSGGAARIEVVGELRGRGSDLVAVLRSENFRSLLTD